ncbi:succinate dehydrogenase subunit C protein [Rutstroemia sp. NJR-2017a WRK4]|nr:succinate dehydrogenase subunit C protein [Rutstroemia sp. NJR-2017a WRK4]
MLSQRTTQHALRRLAAGQPTIISQLAMRKMVAPAVLGAAIQTRPVTTQKVTPEDSYSILAAQRRKRPTSPHLTIYQPQIPWIMSGLNRITGCILSGSFYIFGLSYLASPLFGWHMDTASMAAAFAAWPMVLQVLAKFTFALPFTYHGLNGLRHLSWDMGKALKNKEVVRTGWAIVGLSVTSALALVAFF